jgi:hypothetical protein
MLKNRIITELIKPKKTNVINADETRISRHAKPLRNLKGARERYFAPNFEVIGVRTAISYQKQAQKWNNYTFYSRFTSSMNDI